jgi:hypothetical protein
MSGKIKRDGPLAPTAKTRFRVRGDFGNRRSCIAGVRLPELTFELLAVPVIALRGDLPSWTGLLNARPVARDVFPSAPTVLKSVDTFYEDDGILGEDVDNGRP